MSIMSEMSVTIRDAAAKSGLPVKTVRYYDEINLVSPATRSAAGYRLYLPQELHQLGLVKRARSFGFTVDECRDLLALLDNESRSSREVKSMANRRLEELEIKMRDMQVLYDELKELSLRCPGNDEPNCPILDSLARKV